MADRSEAPPDPSPQANNVLTTKLDPTSARFEANMRFLADLVSQVRNEEEKIREGGGTKAIESQHAKGRLTARERINCWSIPEHFSNWDPTQPTACMKSGAERRRRA